jgi:uncharacterized membrane protein (DUF106 family)
MKKLFLYLSISVYVLAVLPLPLAFLVDMTFHWLLIVTIPVGAILGSIFLIIWAVLKDKERKEEMKSESNKT